MSLSPCKVTFTGSKDSDADILGAVVLLTTKSQIHYLLKVKYIICYELELFIQPMKTQVMQTEIT